MTRRAARMLAALEDGCTTRDQIFAHQGRFSLLNNAAAELRAAGITVICDLHDGDYRYRLDDGGGANGAEHPSFRALPAPIIEPDGQCSLDLEEIAA